MCDLYLKRILAQLLDNLNFTKHVFINDTTIFTKLFTLEPIQMSNVHAIINSDKIARMYFAGNC